jgi:hypothetical protein
MKTLFQISKAALLLSVVAMGVAMVMLPSTMMGAKIMAASIMGFLVSAGLMAWSIQRIP